MKIGKFTTPATKEFFVPVTYGTEMGATGYHPGALVDAIGEGAYMEFFVPADFSSITSAVVVGIVIAADKGVAFPMVASLYSNYGALDEHYAIHSEVAANANNVEGASTISDLISWNIAGIFSSLVANDQVGIKLEYTSVMGDLNHTDARILGVWFKYS